MKRRQSVPAQLRRPPPFSWLGRSQHRALWVLALQVALLGAASLSAADPGETLPELGRTAARHSEFLGSPKQPAPQPPAPEGDVDGTPQSPQHLVQAHDAPQDHASSSPADADSGDELCTHSLRDMVNYAISTVIETRELTDYILPLWNGIPYVQILLCVPSTNPYEQQTPQLPAEELHSDDLLYKILERGFVRVAGAGTSVWNNKIEPPNKGKAGNYKLDLPTGIFPDYLRAIWRIIGEKFKTTVTVQYTYYGDSDLAQDAVWAGKADMTDIYFYLGQKTRLGENPLHQFYTTCPILGTPLQVYAKGKNVSFADLIRNIKEANSSTGDNQNKPTALSVAIGSADLAVTILPTLPSPVTVNVASDNASAISEIITGDFDVAVTAGSPEVHHKEGIIVHSKLEVVLANGAWIRRSKTFKCLSREHRVLLRN